MNSSLGKAKKNYTKNKIIVLIFPNDSHTFVFIGPIQTFSIEPCIFIEITTTQKTP